MRFSGKVALVTGIASGIGRATGWRLADEGATVVGFDRVEGGGIVDTFPARADASHGFHRGDVASEREVRGLFENIKARWGRLDIVVNCAGATQRNAVHEMDLEEWRHVIDVNLTGTFLVAREAFRLMMEQGGGAIVNVSSELALVGHPRRAGYTAAKAGVLGLTRTLALEGAQALIRVNAVCPGATDTPMYWSSHKRDEQTDREIHDTQPLKRLCRPEEIAAGIAFLASDEAACAVGSVLVIDGGYTVR